MEKIYLTEEGAKAVLDALENPPPITDALREAVESYKKANPSWKDCAL